MLEKKCFQETWCRQTNLKSKWDEWMEQRRISGREENGEEAFIDGHLARPDGGRETRQERQERQVSCRCMFLPSTSCERWNSESLRG